MPFYRYRLFWEDGSDAGEAEYAVWVKEGETIMHGGPREQLRVLDVVPVDDDKSPYVGFLKVAPLD